MQHHGVLSPHRGNRSARSYEQRDAANGVLLAAALGAILLLPFGLVAWGDGTGLPLRLLSMAALGLLMGACLGAVYLGDRVVHRRRRDEGDVRGPRP